MIAPLQSCWIRQISISNLPSKDGSNVAVWNAVTGGQLSSWLESYNPQIGKGLIWGKAAAACTTEFSDDLADWRRVPNCASPSNSGSQVFPFFSDVHDLKSWQT